MTFAPWSVGKRRSAFASAPRASSGSPNGSPWRLPEESSRCPPCCFESPESGRGESTAADPVAYRRVVPFGSRLWEERACEPHHHARPRQLLPLRAKCPLEHPVEASCLALNWVAPSFREPCSPN